MKSIVPILLLLVLLAHPVTTSAERIKPEDWGVATNGAQLYLGLATGGNTIELGDPVVLWLRVRNVSTDGKLSLFINGLLESDSTFMLSVRFPSGKDISLPPHFVPGGGGVTCYLNPDQAADTEYHFPQRSKLDLQSFKRETCKFDELGTYKITATMTMSTTESPFIKAISKPLQFSVVAKGTNNPARFAAYKTPPWTRFKMVADPNELPPPLAYPNPTPAVKKDDHFELVIDPVSGNHAIITLSGALALKSRDNQTLWSQPTRFIGHGAVTSAYLDRETIQINFEYAGGTTRTIRVLCKDGKVAPEPYF